MAIQDWPFLTDTTVIGDDFWTLPKGTTVTRDFENIPAIPISLDVRVDTPFTNAFIYQPATVVAPNTLWLTGTIGSSLEKSFLYDITDESAPVRTAEYTTSANLIAAVYPKTPNPVATAVFYIPDGDFYSNDGNFANGPTLIAETYGGTDVGGVFVFDTGDVVGFDTLAQPSMEELVLTPSYNSGCAMVGDQAYWASYTGTGDPLNEGNTTTDGLTGALYIMKVNMGAGTPSISTNRYQINYGTARSVQGIGYQPQVFIAAMRNGDLVLGFGTVEKEPSSTTSFNGDTYDVYKEYITIYTSTTGTAFIKMDDINIGNRFSKQSAPTDPSAPDVYYADGNSADDFIMLSTANGMQLGVFGRRQFIRRINGSTYSPLNTTVNVGFSQLVFDGTRYGVIASNVFYEVSVGPTEVTFTSLGPVPEALQYPTSETPRGGKKVGNALYYQKTDELLLYPYGE